MKAIFLDRDGVINLMYKGDWVRTWERFVWLLGAKEALALLHEKGYICVVITNQSCVGRGIVPRETVDEINGRMLAEVEAAGGKIDAIYVCPHRPDAGCDCRKPAIGNFKKAMEDFGLKPGEFVFVGDSDSDEEAARRVGCAYEKVDEKRALLDIVKTLRG